jgi:FkbM family methyltransferase
MTDVRPSLAGEGTHAPVDTDEEVALGRLPVALKRRLRRLMPRRVSPHRIWSGPLRGRRLVTSWHDYPAAILGYTERSLVRWLQANVQPGQTWIDVGAHYGYTALALSGLVGPRGRVFAFEPVLTTAGHLSTTRRLNDLRQLTVVPLGLGMRGGIHPVDVPLVRGMADHVADGRAVTMDRVLAVAFDEVWPGIAQGERRIHGVKIDVQGMEIDVLTGMGDALRSSRPVLVVEIHHGVDRTVLLQLRSDLGYGRRPDAPEAPNESHGSNYLDNRSYCFLPSSPGAVSVRAPVNEPSAPGPWATQ